MSDRHGSRLVDVTKVYGDTTALDRVHLEIRPGTVHALVGENGAGKSTALKILAGLEQPTSGTVVDDGTERSSTRHTPVGDARIGVVAQQLSLIGEFTLAENFILPGSRRWARRRRAEAELAEVARAAGLPVPVDVPVNDLELSQRQLGELAIALALGARTLLLDEPTSALGPHETDALFEKVGDLAAQGISILLITHRVAEVRAVADDVTVLTRGRVTLSGPVAGFTDAELVTAMVGSAPSSVRRRGSAHDASRAVRLRLEEVTTPGRRGITDFSAEVRSGEVLGILGVAGNGQSALADVAAGIVAPRSGSVIVDDADVTGNPARAAAAGVSYVPAVRTDFLLPAQPLTKSVAVRLLVEPVRWTRRGRLDWAAITEFTAVLLRRHDVRPPDPRLPVAALSGGNQQKLLVGRELHDEPAVVILHGPTQGLDVGAAAAIRRAIREAADEGAAVLLISADMDEVREVADRIAVMSRGRLIDEFDTDDFDLQRVGNAMAGLVDARIGAPQ